MARHRIQIEQPPKMVLHSDVVFSVYSNEAKLGELRISKGSIDWVPAGQRRAYWLLWERFDEVIQELGRRRRA
jgi:hypothetical protein